MEASAVQARPGVTRHRASIGSSLLRLRSDEQLVELFRTGNDDAFGAIHDRYRTRLFAYMRQMLAGSNQDAEDALQDVFMKAFAGLRANDRQLALRAWLYRVAHNRCIDQIRRATPAVTLAAEPLAPAVSDPATATEQREELRSLMVDVGRLPDQQRSALLMRELSGMSYAELAETLDLSVPAVKSVLVRARVSLAAAAAARDTACDEIRVELAQCHERGVKATATAQRHLRDCSGCRDFRSSMRGASRQLAVLTPALGPLGALAKLLGLGSGTAAAGSGTATAAAGGAAVGGGAIAGSATASTGALAGGHLATLIAAAVVTAGGAVAIQPVLAPSQSHHARPAGDVRSARSGITAADAVRRAAISIASEGTSAFAPGPLAVPTQAPKLSATAKSQPSVGVVLTMAGFRLAGAPAPGAATASGGSALYLPGGGGASTGVTGTASGASGNAGSVAGAANTYGTTTGTGTGTASAGAGTDGAGTSSSATGTSAGGTLTDPTSAHHGGSVPAGSSPSTATATPATSQTSAGGTAGASGSSSDASTSAVDGAATTPAFATATPAQPSDGGAGMGAPGT